MQSDINGQDFDDIDYGNVFLGEAAAQTPLIDALSTNIVNKPGVHVVCGGPRSGKTTVIETATEKMSRQARLHPRNSKPYLHDERVGRLESALLDIGDSFQMYESGGEPPHRVIVMRDQVDYPRDASLIEPVIKAWRKLPPGLGTLSVVLDVPNLVEPLLPGAVSVMQKREHTKAEESLRKLCARYPEVTLYRTPYNRAQTQEAIWLEREKGVPVQLIEDALSDFCVDVTHPSVRDALKALQERNREKYDFAFSRIPDAAKAR